MTKRILTKYNVSMTLNILISIGFIVDYCGKLMLLYTAGWSWLTFACFTYDSIGKLFITLMLLEKILIKRSHKREIKDIKYSNVIYIEATD